MKKPIKVSNMHEQNENTIDPYYWVKNMNEDEKFYFKAEEEQYT